MTDHLAKAKDYIAKGEDYYRRAAEEIVAAKAERPELTWTEIGQQLGRSERWVRRLVAARADFLKTGEFEVDHESGTNKRDEVVSKALTDPVKRREAIASLKSDEIEQVIGEANDVAIERLRARSAEQRDTAQPTTRDLMPDDRFDPAEHWIDTLVIRVNRNARELQDKIKRAGGLLYGSMTPAEAFEYLHEAEGMIAEARAAAQEQIQDGVTA